MRIWYYGGSDITDTMGLDMGTEDNSRWIWTNISS